MILSLNTLDSFSLFFPTISLSYYKSPLFGGLLLVFAVRVQALVIKKHDLLCFGLAHGETHIHAHSVLPWQKRETWGQSVGPHRQRVWSWNNLLTATPSPQSFWDVSPSLVFAEVSFVTSFGGCKNHFNFKFRVKKKSYFGVSKCWITMIFIQPERGLGF